MNTVRNIVVLIAAVALPFVALAQVYKWKDKDGTVRYTDTPPPSNIKTETIVKKKAVAAPPAAAEPAAKAPEQAGIVVPETPDAAAQRRREQAEIDKKNKQEQEAEARRKADNCIAAKSNMEAYKQGGRVYRTNAKGEREYLDDKAFEQGRQRAQQEINENC